MSDIAKEYGTALFMLACEENAKKEYADALQSIKDIFLQYPQYPELLSSPSIPLNERLGIIGETFSAVLPEHVLSFLMLLCEKGRMTCFSDAFEEYKALLDASEHVSSAKITSAVELTDEEKEKLIKKLELTEARKISAEYYIDPTLLGGLIVEIDGKILDGSLRHRLRDVKGVMNT